MCRLLSAKPPPCHMVTFQPLPPPLMANNTPRMRPHKRKTTRTWLVPPMRLPRPWPPLKIIYMPHRTFSQRTLGDNDAHDDANDLDIHDYEAPPSPVPMCRHQVSWTSVSSCQQFWTPSPTTTLAWPHPPHTQTTTSSLMSPSLSCHPGGAWMSSSYCVCYAHLFQASGV